MPNVIETVINYVYLLVGFAMILWGLKLFKLYIILTGIAVGMALGPMVIACVFGLALDGNVFLGWAMFLNAVSEHPGLLLIAAAVGAIVGGSLAWPLRKLLVFLIAGFWSGLLGAVILAALEAPQNVLLGLGFGLFVIGGAVAVYFYEYVIIILMALGGAQTVFHTVFSTHVVFAIDGFAEVWRYLLHSYAERIMAFLLSIGLFVWFAFYFQKRAVVENGDDRRKQLRVIRLRRLSYLLSGLAVVGYVLTDLVGPAFSGTVLIGSSVFSWPLVALASGAFAAWLACAGERCCLNGHTRLCRFLYMLLFSLIIPPLITWVVTCVLSVQVFPLWYYQAFFSGSPAALVSKWVCALLVVPGLFYLTALRELGPPLGLAVEDRDEEARKRGKISHG